MSNTQPKHQQQQHLLNGGRRKRGVDVLLTAGGKNLRVGESCSFRLSKGPATQSTKDPVDPKAPPQIFPLLAKFPEVVMRPDFTNKPWSTARLYQQDIPKPDADSDEEDNTAAAQQQKKKRWKYNNQKPDRQWILQEQVDFLETMVARREKRKAEKRISSKYEGVPEHNASRYVLIMAPTDPATADGRTLVIRTLPAPFATIPFAQPAARQSYSLVEAEQVIQDQRMGIRTLRHDGNAAAGAPTRMVHKSAVNSKKRLEQKLKKVSSSLDKDLEDGDDVMGDVTFRNRKGTGGAARRELLETLGDGVPVNEEGVIGGTNDAAFGGKNRFGQLQVEKNRAAAGGEAGAAAGGDAAERGADGAAMEEDFYQRDVKAEYEELDYDANEQFDDDDVDLGEAEQVVDSGGFGGDEDEEDELEELDQEEEAITGAEGLASAAGFKAMLAKARGEVVADDATLAAAAAAAQNQHSNNVVKEEQKNHMDNIIRAAEGTVKVLGRKSSPTESDQPPPKTTIQVDANGFRIITQEAVRREIWLNHGSITMKRLMKIFDVKKKSAERQSTLLDVVKELCIMKTDPVAGRILVLKQHYANMG